MIDIIPFKAVVPIKNKAHLVASRSYITYKKEELEHKLNYNPFSFLNIINAGRKEKKGTQPESVRKKYLQFLEIDNILQKLRKNSLYIYKQCTPNNTYTGIIAGTSVKNYKEGRIKKHEEILTKREIMFFNYLKKTRINAEPTLLTYPDNKKINDIILQVISLTPNFDFFTTDKVRHQLWIIDKKQDIKNIIKLFKNIDNLYIADGHHRSASSAHLNKNDSSKATNYYMSFLLAESQIKIYNFNRLVKDINGLSEAEFIKKIRLKFDVAHIEEDFIPKKVHQMSMYINKKWYSLVCKKEILNENHSVKSLDVEILNKNILNPILNIKDLKKDKRISFMGGLNDIKIFKDKIDKEYKVGFVLNPITINQLKKVADEGKYMPPKSTWVEPKLRSGLIIYEF